MKYKLHVLLTTTLLLSISGVAEARTSCKSFNTQAEAQAYYDAKKKGWKSLDRDKDGEPCECLPGGSKYGESVCRSWRKKNGK